MGYSVIWFCTYMMLVIAQDNTADKQCDIRSCPGPLAHYKSLNCQPVYQYDDCCAWHYNCDHLHERINAEQRHEKCYANGHEYNIGESIREEDKNVCEEDCVCTRLSDGFADFDCAISSDTLKGPFTGCWREALEQCLPTAIPCIENTDRLSCNVDGNTYTDGEYMMLKGRPDLLCMCRADFPGRDYVKCTNFSRRADVHAAYNFYKNCAPIYIEGDQVFLGYHWYRWRCHENNDVVIPGNNNSKPGKYSVRELCRFGEKTMEIGDKLNNITFGSKACVTCTCEVPPVPTCFLLNKELCHF